MNDEAIWPLLANSTSEGGSPLKALIQVCVALTIHLFLVACPPGPRVEVSCDDFYRTQNTERGIEVAAGKSFTIALCSNPSTGFSWGEALISYPGVVAEVGHEYDAREGKDPPAPGTPGAEVWTLKVLQPGQSSVSIEYGRPWDGGAKAEWTFVLTVVAR